MKTAQIHIRANASIDAEVAKLKQINPQLVLMFGSNATFAPGAWAEQVAKAFPNSNVLGCSTAGEITKRGVFDDSLVVTASQFDATTFQLASAKVESMEETFKAGRDVALKLEKKGLKAVFALACGVNINGSALIEGMRDVLGHDIVITGGLAGDQGRFQQTFTIVNGAVSDRSVVALGLYGERVGVSFGSMGGWEAFGPVRRVTKSKANVLFELDGEPALDIYKKYLGDKAKDLPGAGLLYPFALLKDNQDSMGLVRTILAIDEKEKSLTLAGEIPQNGIVRLMHTNNSGLVGGAKGAADSTADHSKDGVEDPNALSILISCVGRKLVMGDEIEDEFDAVKEVLGQGMMTGFYSNGEISPLGESKDAKLHNQTMTITYLYEKKAV